MEEFSLFNDGLEGLVYTSPDAIDPASDLALLVRGLSGFGNIWHFSKAASLPADKQPKRMMDQMHLLRNHPVHHTDRTWPGTVTRSLRRLAERQRDRHIRAPLRRALGSVADQLTPAQWDALDLIGGRLAIFAGSRSRAKATDRDSLVAVSNAQRYMSAAIGEAFNLQSSPFNQSNLDFPVEVVRSAVGALACHLEQFVKPGHRIGPVQLAIEVGDGKMTHVPDAHSPARYYDETAAPSTLSALEFSMRAVANNEVAANKEPYWNLCTTMTGAHHIANASLYNAAAEKAKTDRSIRDTLHQLGNPALGHVLVSLGEIALREHGRKHPHQMYSLDAANDRDDAIMHTQLNDAASAIPQQVATVITSSIGERLVMLPTAQRAQLGAFIAETAAQQMRLNRATDTAEWAAINAVLAKGLRYEGQNDRPVPDADKRGATVHTLHPRGK